MQPTFPCHDMTPAERKQKIRTTLATISDVKLLDDIATPQGSAFDWIIRHDTLYICPGDVESLIQRYVLATLYYSTKGDNWSFCSSDPTSDCPESVSTAVAMSNGWECDADSTRWLAGSNECSWCGITCADGMYATEIDIGKSAKMRVRY